MKRILLILALLLQHVCDAQIVVTVAGGATGHGGYWGDGGAATSAQLGIFGGLAVDNLGNIYIADGSNQRIRKVDHVSRIITTVAGTGTAGFNGDSILAITAKLNSPGLVFVDGNDNFYIGDGNNNRIRKVDTLSGIITTFAGNGIFGFSGDGGPATAADCDFQACFFDQFGNMIVEASRDHRIRKIDLSGFINTIGGTGFTGNSGDGGPATAATMAPDANGICTDRFGNIYFSDSFNSVRKINISTGIITRVAGTGDHIGSPYSGDGGPATMAHITPVSTAVDDTGNLYILANSMVLKVDTFGIIHRFAGIGTIGFSGDGGPAISAEFGAPENIVLDRCGNIYIADFNNARVRKIIVNPSCSLARIDSVSLSAPELTTTKPVSVYPNPARDAMTILNAEGSGELTIVNTVGQVVLHREIKQRKEMVDMEGWTVGVYMVRVVDEEGNRSTTKVIKQ